MTFCKHYAMRDSVLLSMGYSSYSDYLNSILWAEIRDIVLERDRYTCRLCGKKASQAHHITYIKAALTGEDIGRIISLCYQCHKRLEFNKSGKKNTLAQANKEFGLAMRRKQGKRKRLNAK